MFELKVGAVWRHPSYLNLHYKQLLVYCTLGLQVLGLETHLGVGEGPDCPFPHTESSICSNGR